MGRKQKKRSARARSRAKGRGGAAARRHERADPGGTVPTGGALYRCLVPLDLSASGMGNVFVVRHIAGDRVAIGRFLLDLFCQGVWEASLDLGSRLRFDAFVARERAKRELIATDLACVAKLIHGAVAYARGLGLEPPAEFSETVALLGDADPGACLVSYEYGWRGKPVFRPGPRAEPEQFKETMRTLLDRLGCGGFRLNLQGSSITAVELLELGLGGPEIERLFSAE